MTRYKILIVLTLISVALWTPCLTLYSLAQVVSLPLLVDDRLVDLASGQVVVLGEPDVQEAFVVPQVQVHLATIVQHKHFPWT